MRLWLEEPLVLAALRRLRRPRLATWFFVLLVWIVPSYLFRTLLWSNAAMMAMPAFWGFGLYFILFALRADLLAACFLHQALWPRSSWPPLLAEVRLTPITPPELARALVLPVWLVLVVLNTASALFFYSGDTIGVGGLGADPYLELLFQSIGMLLAWCEDLCFAGIVSVALAHFLVRPADHFTGAAFRLVLLAIGVSILLGLVSSLTMMLHGIVSLIIPSSVGTAAPGYFWSLMITMVIGAVVGLGLELALIAFLWRKLLRRCEGVLTSGE